MPETQSSAATARSAECCQVHKMGKCDTVFTCCDRCPTFFGPEGDCTPEEAVEAVKAVRAETAAPRIRVSGWFAAAGQMVGNVHQWSMEYTWDGTVYPTRAMAISHGIGVFGHDDFNVGRLENGDLVWWGWMDEQHPEEDYAEAAKDLGLHDWRAMAWEAANGY